MDRSLIGAGGLAALATAFEPWEHEIVAGILSAHGVRIAKTRPDIDFDDAFLVDLATVNRMGMCSIVPALVKEVCLEVGRDGEWIDEETSEITGKVFSRVARNAWDDPALIAGLQLLADKERRGVLPVDSMAQKIGWGFEIPFFETLARRAEVFPYAVLAKRAEAERAPAP
jgi:hypothetical protein